MKEDFTNKFEASIFLLDKESCRYDDPITILKTILNKKLGKSDSKEKLNKEMSAKYNKANKCKE